MKITSHWPGVTKHLIAFALGWCLLSILLGLFYSFDAMENSKAVQLQIILRFIKVATLTFLIGIAVLSLPLLIWKMWNKNKGDKPV